MDHATHMWIAAVELECDLPVRPCRVADVAAPLEQQLVLESGAIQPVLVRSSGDERLPLVS